MDPYQNISRGGCLGHGGSAPMQQLTPQAATALGATSINPIKLAEAPTRTISFLPASDSNQWILYAILGVGIYLAFFK